jgi:hypothetical protein
LRQHVKNASTLEDHIALHDEIGAWRGLLREQTHLTERMKTLAPAVRSSLSDLLGSIDDAEKGLRRKVADDAVEGLPALARLKALRVQAESAFTPERRDYIRHQVDAWKRNPLGQATGVAP